jgi:anaerobic selenocysteine-containing dehydrogenase
VSARTGSRTVGRTCSLCEAMCGLTIQVHDGGRVGTIRGDRDDPWSRGYVCPKGTVLGHLHEDPDRLRAPLVRDGETWREVTWPEAYARCEELLHGVIARHGRDAITAYVGNPAAHSIALSRYVGPMVSGMPMIWSAGTVDTWPRNVASVLMYGNAWLLPIPDIQRTDHFFCLGANPHASNGSLFTCADVMGEIDRVRARGGTVTVVDPRRTGTAERADEWVPIQPGTDAAFLLALLHVLFAEDLVDLGTVADLVDGLDAVREVARAYPPERVEAATRVPAATTRRLARALAAAEAPAVYGRIGLCNQEFGTLASWLVDVVAICVGGFDRPGGVLFGNPMSTTMMWMPSTRATGPVEFGRWRTRVRGAPEVLGQVPIGFLAEEIATPGPGQIRGLIVVAGNPVISTPDPAQLDAALPELECMISLDNYLNETSRHAHVILPGPSQLEIAHFDALYPAWAVRTVARWSDPTFERPAGMPEEWETLLRLQGLLLGMRNDQIDVGALDDAFFGALCAATGVDPAVAARHHDGGGPERLVDWGIRTGPFGDRYGERPDGWNLAKVKAHPHGIDLGPLVPRAHEAVCTPSGRIDLAPAHIVADLPRLDARLDASPAPLVLVSRRHLRSNNSWLHNVPVLVKGKERCTLLVHPADAAAHGLVDGDLAAVSSPAGTIEVPVEVTDEMLPGVVCLPHGWGHDRPGTRLAVAREHAGVNNNLVAPNDLLDSPSGNHALNGIPVALAPAGA